MTDSKELTYVELPQGIFTSDGIWFHTSEHDLGEFAPGIVEKLGLTALLKLAGEWSRLAVTSALWVLPCFLLVSFPWQAALGSLLVYLLMAVMSPSVVFFSLFPAIKWINNPIVQGLYYVLMLSFFASSNQFGALGTGLAGFVLLRWQIVTRLLTPVVHYLSRPLSALPVYDQILRNVLIRGSQKFGLPLPELDKMEQRVLEILNYHKRAG